MSKILLFCVVFRKFYTAFNSFTWQTTINHTHHTLTCFLYFFIGIIWHWKFFCQVFEERVSTLELYSTAFPFPNGFEVVSQPRNERFKTTAFSFSCFITPPGYLESEEDEFTLRLINYCSVRRKVGLCEYQTEKLFSAEKIVERKMIFFYNFLWQLIL